MRLPLATILLTVALCWLGWTSARAAEGRAVHYQSAEMSVSTVGGYGDPSRTLAASAVPTAWRTAALPNVLPRSGGRDTTILSRWYRLRYAGAPSRHAVYLYIPRWQVTGKLAIWADRQLAFAPRSGPQWMGFNTPVWVKLADPGQPAPEEIIIRINSLKRSGGGLSTVWIGDENVIGPRHAVRHWLQVTLTAVIGYGAGLAGAIALAMWIWWRRDPAFLLLFFASAFNTVWEVQFRTGEAALPLSEPWFGWMTINALEWWILSIYLFSLQIIGFRFKGVAIALFVLTVLFSVLTLPVSAMGVTLSSANLSPLLDDITLLVVAVFTISLWIAYGRRRSHEGLVLCLCNSSWPLAGVHDVMLQHYKISIETVCLSPVVFGLLLFSLIYIVARRYFLALRDVEQHATRLEARVRQREAELELSHARMRLIEQRETVAHERQRLMRDMHDGMGSSLMGALAAVERGHLRDIDVAQMLRECIDDLKLTIDSLETVESDLPLVLATLRYRLGPRFEQAGIALNWRVTTTPPLDWMDSERALQVLRMVQEIFTNVVKHARASEVTVATRLADGAVVLSVEDNGVGFSADEADRPGRRGLANLRQRASLIGASVAWTSAPGSTRFELRLPLAQGGPLNK